MNKVSLIGRLTRDPDIRYLQNENETCVARYTLAVNRKYKREGKPEADFIQCVVFGRMAETASNYFYQGLKIAVSGRIETDSYTNKDGQKVYTTTVVVEDQEFVEKKSANLRERESNEGSNQFDEVDEMEFAEHFDSNMPF